YFQSFGAVSIVKINAQWFHVRQRGTFAAIFGVLIRFGLWLGFGVAPWIGKRLGWQGAFLVPAAFVALLFVLVFLFVRDTPAEAGFGALAPGDASGGGRPRVADVLVRIFGSRTLWMIALASMMIGFVRRSIVDAWWPVYFNDVLHLEATDLPYQLASFGIMILGIL